MFYSSGDHKDLSRPQFNYSVFKVDLDPPGKDMKKFVGVFMPMPDELAMNVDHTNVIVVNGGNIAWLPLIVEGSKGLGEIHFF